MSSESFSLTIDGKAVAGQNSFPVVNPALGTPFAEAPDCTQAQLDDAMSSSANAFLSWRKDEARRRATLRSCGDALMARHEEIAQLLTREQGKPIAKAREEVLGAGFWFQQAAELPLATEVLADDDEQRIELHRRPIGVVGAITPWNFPVILACWKIAPALLAGNTLVLKPSPFTPLSSLKMGEVLRDVLPPGVMNVVSGGDDLGKWVCEHPTVRKISFTGSVPTGKKILAGSAPDLKRVTLELGGNDPAIVLGDVDPKAIAEKLFWGAFNNSGQICIAVKRVYAEEKVYQPIVDELAKLAKNVKIGDGLEDDTDLGPINNEPQFRRVNELIDSARSDGAKFVAGGEPVDGPGYFVAPTIVTGLEDGTRLVDEEQFGPVLPIIPVRNAEDALERANRSHFGLGGSVWSADSGLAAKLAGELHCGTGWVNQHGGLSPAAPFGGWKWSGMGRENGTWGLAAFTELQVISIAK
jgi:acyl-CoA reductase-like NAD-dependent aldehyde dehydrogenase